MHLLNVKTVLKAIRQNILKDITAKEYTTIAFTLKCSEETLENRHKKRGDTGEGSFHWQRREPHPGDYVIDTDNKSVAQIIDEIKSIINDRRSFCFVRKKENKKVYRVAVFLLVFCLDVRYCSRKWRCGWSNKPLSPPG